MTNEEYEIYKEEYAKFLAELLVAIRDSSSHGYYDGAGNLYVSWSAGGTTGASCWDDSPSDCHYSGQSPMELEILDDVLNRFRPQIGLMEYRQLKKAVEKSDTHTDYDYYGNSSSTCFRKVNVEELFKYMKEKSWL